MLIRTGPYRDDAIDSVQKEMLYLVHMREGPIDLVPLLLDAIRSATDGSPEREFCSRLMKPGSASRGAPPSPTTLSPDRTRRCCPLTYTLLLFIPLRQALGRPARRHGAGHTCPSRVQREYRGELSGTWWQPRRHRGIPGRRGSRHL